VDTLGKGPAAQDFHEFFEEGVMNRGRYYATVMPIAAILYAIALAIWHNGNVAVVGALLFALLAVLGSVVARPSQPGQGR
jgi:uncharacterized membrane protein YfbV (UPF0208 family)